MRRGYRNRHRARSRQEIDDWLDRRFASFETAALRPPQDDGFL